MKILNKFQNGLRKTSSLITSSINDVFKSNKIDQNTLDEIESALISSDIGLEVTNLLIKKTQSLKGIHQQNINSVLELLAVELELILTPREDGLIKGHDSSPTVLLFIGVNGSGKTTTIGKIINKIGKDKKILIGACDTFRAAAVEQLSEWAEKQSIEIVKGSVGEDPASVAFNSAKKTIEEKYDYLIIDTAGRLSNNANLLNQLIKIKSVISKSIIVDNIKTILVLDGTNGSNMIKQVEVFEKSMNVNGLIITKIDGTAKGGALIPIAKNYTIPINFVGFGEKVDDLVQFNARKFAHSMLNIEIKQ